MGTLEAKLFITAQDDTGAAFKALEERISRVAKMANEIGRLGGSAAGMSGSAAMAGEFERAEKAATAMAAAMEKAGSAIGAAVGKMERLSNQAQRAEKHVSALGKVMHGVKHFTKEVSPLVMGGAGFGMLETTKHMTEKGAEVQGERARMKVAGIPDLEIDAADAQSQGLTSKYTNVDRASVLEAYKETRSVLLDKRETPGMMDSIIGAKSAMLALNPHDPEAADGLQFAVKGAEVMGIAQNKDRFRSYLDSFIKAQEVMGKTITPEQQFQFAQMVKSSGIMLSDRFKMTTGVSLAQEMKGGMTGQAVDQFVKQIVGGFQGNNHSAAKEFVKLDLAKKSDFETTKTGEIKGMKHGRKVDGADLAATDPDTWVYQKLIPAMEKHGITSLGDQISQVRRMFPAGRAADLVSKMISQRESFANHAKLYGEAAGLEGGQTLLKEDPSAALNALGTAISNFGGTLTSPIMKQAAATMSSMASQISSWGQGLADWQKSNPQLSKFLAGGAIAGGVAGGGALGYGALSGLMGGFGLKGSAVALDGAAASLEGAAAKIALGSAESTLGTAAKVAGGATLAGVGFAGVGIGSAVLGATAEPTPNAETQKKMDDFYKSNPHAWKETFAPIADLWHKMFPPISGFGISKYSAITPPAGVGFPTAPAGVSALSKAGQAAPVKVEARVAPDQISAKLTGQADVHVKVTVEPSGALLKAAATASSTPIKPAATGTSMQEAMPGGGTGGAGK